MHNRISTTTEIISQAKEAFSQTPVSVRNAVKALNNVLLHMCNIKLSEDESRNIYFYVLRGLGTDNVYLQSMLYSTILYMRKSTKDSCFAINSLMKDLNNDTHHIIKGKGLMTLFSLLPATMNNDFEKYITQGLVSRFEQRKGAAVIIGYLNSINCKDDVKRWVSTINLIQNIPIRDYHLFALFSQIKDHKSIERLILDNQNSKGPAGVILVNMLHSITKHEIGAHKSLFIKFMKSSDEMVSIEAVKIVSKFDDVTPFIETIIPILRKGLQSTKKSVKFASMRIASVLSQNNDRISTLNKEIENMINNDNKVISMMAVTTLLKTGNEQTIDKLVGIIPTTIDEMTDSFKILMISALESLAMKFKSKEETFILFMKSSLQTKGSVKFKRHIINVMERISRQDLSFAEKILELTSNYIEDSSDSLLTMDIIGFMGLFIGKSCNYKKYIVHIFNRLILDNPQVKCASLQALYFISNDIPEIRECIRSILFGFTEDDDDLVSNEAIFLLEKIENQVYNLLPLTKIRLNDYIDYKDEINKYLNGEDIFEEEKQLKVDPIIKKTKETLLNNRNDDFNIFLTKYIYSDKVILSLRILNKLEDITFKSGQLNIVCNDNINKEKTNIKIASFKNETVIERCININQNLCSREKFDKDFICLFENEFKISQEKELIFNSNFVYEICGDEDFGEIETDTITFQPFSINMFDYILPFDVQLKDLKYNKKFSLKVLGDIVDNKNRIKNMFNMMVVEEDLVDGFKLKMSGQCMNESLLVSVSCNKVGFCETIINTSDELLLQNVIKKVCE